jgi:aryl-alcohol dehydrogenase-like predicted oxidoreductase
MRYNLLGKTGLYVSELCLGSMTFGGSQGMWQTIGQLGQQESLALVATALDAGVNFIDTADVYTKGASEEMVGRLLAGNRTDWILATKLGNQMGSAPNQSHYSRTWIMNEIDASLRRLATDYVDILYLHRDFIGENLEEPVRAMGDLIRAGKIRYWAVSNFRGWRIAEIAGLCDKLGVPRPVACQPYYNLLNRMPEVEILPACNHFGLGVVPYSPIARGVLTGKYLPGQQPDANSRAGRADKRMMETEFREESLVIAQTLKAHAEARGLNAGQFATAWVLANAFVSSVIAGPRTLAQFEDYFGAVGAAISAEEEAMVDALVPRGHASTHGYNDPSYPFVGR